MNEPIFIARQDTLDEKIIPAQLLNDYKLHGEYSFVFHTPELWHKMCTHAYAANDQKVNGDALEYVLTKAAPTGSYSLSNWMALLCDTAEQAAQGLYAGIETAGQLAQSSAAMAAVSNSETAMAAVSGSEMAMNSICSVKTALRAFAASKHWNSTVKENDMAIAKAAVALANSTEFSTISSCAEMVENSTAMSVLAASETAMSVLADSATARTALTGSSYYGKYMQNDTMCIAKLVVGFANIASAGYSSMAGVAADATAMNAVAASSTAMNAVAASAVALHAICKTGSARAAFIKSSYRDTNYDTILASLKNTTYFTTVINDGYMENQKGLYYYNGTRQATTEALPADNSFILIGNLQSYTDRDLCYVYDLQSGSTIAHYNDATLRQAKLVIPGGVKVQGIYGGSGHTTYYAFKAK